MSTNDITKEFTGYLMSLSTKTKIDDVQLFIQNETSRQRLFSTAKSGRITRDNQELFFDEIIIPSDKYLDFVKNQIKFNIMGNGISITSTPIHPVRFSGHFQTLISSPSDSNVYLLAKLNIGAIEFDLQNNPGTKEGEITVFNNVKAVIFPVGEYSYEILE